MSTERKAVLYSAAPPTERQRARLEDFILRRHGSPLPLKWRASDMPRGFRLEIGQEVYDWTPEGQLRQLENCIDQALDDREGESAGLSLLWDTVRSFRPSPFLEETGEVLYAGDEIARVGGLPDAQYGEILDFNGPVTGLVLDLREDSLGCVLFGAVEHVTQGSLVRRTGRTASVPVGFRFLGRAVDALGRPIDGKGPIAHDAWYPIERDAPAILDRQPVKTPLETGVLCIDSLFPIGRGQRELIVGDRQTGKTALALDAILNQKGKRVICIYAAIGQKTGSVARLAAELEVHGAMDYTIIVSAGAGCPASEQYIAPFAATAMGEYFMHLGRDVLIVYDDLSKHAVAYRTLSLLLDRSPGREAYPGDVFYLHSRLLERSARLSEALGGGSMTALPIVETQAGDVSAYIPTNLISITDGQIYLDSGLFYAGQRPAVDLGLSVSRVGGDAQSKAMKRATGSLRIELAQFREMEVFTRFTSDLDAATRARLRSGTLLMRLLRQKQGRPLSRPAQVALLTAALGKVMDALEPGQVEDYAAALAAAVEQRLPSLCRKLRRSGELSDEGREKLLELARDLAREAGRGTA